MRRLTGGTPSDEAGLLSARHFCLILRMTYEAGSLSCRSEWNRKYPLSAHDRLAQAYYRGLEVHAPAYVLHYLAGKGFNDIEYFEGRKAEYSPVELERKRKQEHRQKQIAVMYSPFSIDRAAHVWSEEFIIVFCSCLVLGPQARKNALAGATQYS